MVSFGSFITSEPKNIMSMSISRGPQRQLSLRPSSASAFFSSRSRAKGSSVVRAAAHMLRNAGWSVTPHGAVSQTRLFASMRTPCVSRYFSADFRCSSLFPRLEPSARKILLSDIFRSLYCFRHFYHIFVFAHVVNPYYIRAWRQQSAVTASVPASLSSTARPVAFPTQPLRDAPMSSG